jgi:hypothetical protein
MEPPTQLSKGADVSIILVLWICMGIGAAVINSSKGRSAVTGALWGFGLDLIGLIVCAARPSVTKAA